MRYILFLVWMFVGSVVKADTLLLIHGYLGSPQEWHYAGIVQELEQTGWQDAGILRLKQEKVWANNVHQVSSSRRSYQIKLSSDHSISQQAQQLYQYLEFVREKHQDEQIILVGHSAGGVVARLLMVEHSTDDVVALITIASPHLGTNKAEIAQTVLQPIIALLEPLPGLEKLYPSQGLLFDLMPNRTDNLIGWLNFQEHPPAKYYSIVRVNDDGSTFDFIVPSWSQDMNQVYALRGRSETYNVKSMHALSIKDAKVLQKILIDLYTI